MLSVFITTHESERALVPTLAALVPGAVAGLLGDVVVVDAGSKDATAQVAEIAGCRFITSSEALSARLQAAVQTVRTPWLMFLRAGVVPEPGWITAAETFIQATDLASDAARAAVFRSPAAAELMRPGLSDVMATIRAALFGGAPKPEQGLLIARRFYDALGGHPASDDAEAALLRRLGRRRIAVLPASARVAG